MFSATKVGNWSSVWIEQAEHSLGVYKRNSLGRHNFRYDCVDKWFLCQAWCIIWWLPGWCCASFWRFSYHLGCLWGMLWHSFVLKVKTVMFVFWCFSYVGQYLLLKINFTNWLRAVNYSFLTLSRFQVLHHLRYLDPVTDVR